MTAGLGNGPRFAARPVADGGTPATTWSRWDREFPVLELDDCPALILVAPHPDDETLGMGATAATLRARGVRVQVVSVTDGGGAYPGLSPLERRWLERDRREELHTATRILGLDDAIHLELPDGEIEAREDELTAVLVELLDMEPRSTWCAGTWSGDGHPDHEAVGRAVATAATRVDAVALKYPVWMWHWALPGDPDVPWDRMLAVPLPRWAVARKQQAVNVFRTQLRSQGPGLEPVVPPFAVSRLMSVGEAVFR